MPITTMKHEDLVARLNGLVDQKIFEAVQAGSSLFLKIASAEGQVMRSIILNSEWSAQLSSKLRIEHSSFGRYEHNFETKQEWQSYMKQADEDGEKLKKLEGLELHEVKLNDDCSSLVLELENDVRITSTFTENNFLDSHFQFIDPTENLTCSVGKEGVEAQFTELGQIVATREFTFRKSDKDYPATVSIGIPQLVAASGERHESYYCGFEVECELGGAFGTACGADTLQALQHAPIIAQHKIDKLAKKFEAKAFHLDEDMDPIYKFREHFEVLHGLMNRLYTETDFDSQFPASPEGLECLKQMKEVLQLLKEFREDEKP